MTAINITNQGVDSESVGSASSGDDLRERLLKVASEMFARRGYGATSMRQIVSEAGCTKPALYYYFDNKEALFRAIVDREMNAVVELLQRLAARGGTLRERIEMAMVEYVDHVGKNPATAAVMSRWSNHPEHGQPVFDHASLRRRHLRLFREVLQTGVSTGEISDEVDLDEATQLFAAYVEVSTARLASEGETMDPARVRRAVDVFFSGVKPR